MPTLQIPNHDHCAVCGRAIPYTEPSERTPESRTCSPEHEQQLVALNKKRKRSMMIMYGLMALAFVVLILSYGGYLGGK